LIDQCGSTSPTQYTPISSGCYNEVFLQLVSILITNIFIGQATEVGIPYLWGKIQVYRLARSTGETMKEVPIWERDAEKQAFLGTIDEYSEMVIQFGYITLFASCFPLAPLLSVLNNMVEIRSDGFKFLSSYPRPEYRGAQSIGTWYPILEFLGLVAVVTNCLIIGFSFTTLRSAFSTGPGTYNDFAVLGVVVLMEHIILLLKFAISALVPDLPGWIVKKLAHEEFIKQSTLKALSLLNHKPPVFATHNIEEDPSPVVTKKEEGAVTLEVESDKKKSDSETSASSSESEEEGKKVQ